MFHRLKKPVFAMCSGLGALFLAMTADAQTYSVELNKTQILHLPSPAAAIVVGNPEIADVSVHSQNTIFIIGRGYGETNIIVLDEYGQTVMNASVRVGQALADTGVRVLRVGQGRETYSCAPYCLPAPVLGDSAIFIGNFQGKKTLINNTTVSAPTNLPGGSNTFAVTPGSRPAQPANINSAFNRRETR